ncbi:MAG: acyl-CoA dehydrogenase [Ketobacter sp.]
MTFLTMILFSIVALYIRTKPSVTLIGLAVIGVLGSWWSDWSVLTIISALIVFGIAAVLVWPNPLRRNISGSILGWVRNQLPTLSDTESQALKSGDVDWDGELFSGKPNWNNLLKEKRFQLTAEEQAFIDGPVNQLCSMLDDWKITKEDYDLPKPVWEFIRNNGFFGMVVDKKYGGKGFSAAAHSETVMKISTRSVTAAVTVMVPNSLGPAELLQHYGTQAQKDHYLPRLASGAEIPCFALTSAMAGSDAGAIPDEGVVCKGQWNNQEVIGLRVTWNKRYITLAPIATLIGLAIKVVDPDGLLSVDINRGITCVMIPADTEGVHQGARHLPMNQVFMNGPTWGNDVFIPMDYIIGGEQMIGNGWIMLMECLSVGRAISLPALATGAGKHCSLTTGAYAAIRTQFGRSIADFEGVQEALEPIAGYTYMMDSARRMTAAMLDRGIKPTIPSALLKFRNTDLMREVVNDAMDVVAGRAVISGPRNFLARVYQSLPISITVEGANILTRSLMVFGQGAVRCHPFLIQEIEAASAEPSDEVYAKFDKAFFGHLAHALSNVTRSFVLALSFGLLTRAPGDSGPKQHYRQLSRYSASFAMMTDISLALVGGELKAKQRLSGSMADSLVGLYFASASLKRFNDEGCPDYLLPLVDWSVQKCLYDIQMALDDSIRNFPVAWIRPLLRVLVFPLGLRTSAPNHVLGTEVAQLITRAGHARDTLTQGVYINNRPDDAVGRVLNAFKLNTAAYELSKKLHLAVRNSDEADGIKHLELQLEDHRALLLDWAKKNGVLSTQEIQQLDTAMAAVYDALQVDAFEPEAFEATQRSGLSEAVVEQQPPVANVS